MTSEQRQAQTRQIMDSLFAVELDEGTLTFQAWRDGQPVEANVSIGPAALLAVRTVAVAPSKTSQTSPQHAYDVH